MQLKSLLIALFLGLNLSISAQTTDEFSLAMGSSIWHEWLPEDVHYIPMVMLGAFPIWERKNFFIYAEGQLTYATNQVDFSSEYEIGANLGIGYRLNLSNWFNLTALIGSGPNYITIETRRQAKGFIFSDNCELGMNFKINHINTAIQLKARYRHISNAGLKDPNGGIDNLIAIIGIKKTLASKAKPVMVGIENKSVSK